MGFLNPIQSAFYRKAFPRKIIFANKRVNKASGKPLDLKYIITGELFPEQRCLGVLALHT